MTALVEDRSAAAERPDHPSPAKIGDGIPLDRPPLAERKRLLVVDDEVPVLKLVTRILATDNYEIASAESGDTAVRVMEQPGFPGVDLLVTDLMMPGMNGRELAAVVRKSNPQVRVLYVTGFADTLFNGVNELGPAESFIEKPFGADGILGGDAVVDVRSDLERGDAGRQAR